jgi:hypothetical protein
VQPLVRDSVERGASVNEVARVLRSAHGRAYRRADMLEDIRRYRTLEPNAIIVGPTLPAIAPTAPETAWAAPAVAPTVFSLVATVSPSLAAPVPLPFRRAVEPSHWIARAGVAIFAVALLIPTLILDVTRGTGQVLVADVSEVRALGVARHEATLPNQVADLPRRIVTPDPTPTPTPEPPPAPTRAPTPRPVAAVAGGPGVLVTASWYGPGFFENRLPCWQWLQANGLPIQFLPDTWGVAHKTLPCGTMLTLTHGASTITVPVVDRGPYIAGRELDLSPRIKAALGCTDLCTVLMQIR